MSGKQSDQGLSCSLRPLCPISVNITPTHTNGSVIATDKTLFHPKNADIFLISPRKHMLWVHIRSASIFISPRKYVVVLIRSASNEYPQHMFSSPRKHIHENICFLWRNKKNMWIPLLICSYVLLNKSLTLNNDIACFEMIPLIFPRK